MYKNSRLKHVKKIKEICSSIGSIAAKHKFMDPELYKEMGKFSSAIIDQCNLLLETKKKKKSKHSLPNEKEILGMLDGLTIIVRK